MQESTTRKSLYGFDMRTPDLRRKDDTRKTHNAKQLWQRSHEILNLTVRGLKQVDIAEILGLTPQTVSNVVNSDLGMQKISEMRKKRDEETFDAGKEIDELTEKALNVYHDIFDDETGGVELKKKTADFITLELSGLRVPTRIQSNSFNATATLAEIEEFKKRGIEAQRVAGVVIDLPAEDSQPIADS